METKSVAVAAAVVAAAAAVGLCSYRSPTTTAPQPSLAGPAEEVRSYDAATVDHCLDRILETDDGGTATLDAAQTPGVAILTLAPPTAVAAAAEDTGRWFHRVGPHPAAWPNLVSENLL